MFASRLIRRRAPSDIIIGLADVGVNITCTQTIPGERYDERIAEAEVSPSSGSSPASSRHCARAPARISA